MLPSRLGHILGCLAFSEFCSAQNKTLPRSNHYLKIQWEIHFFKRHFFRRNARQKKNNSNYIGLNEKNWFRNWFWISGSAETRKKHETESAGFLVLALPEVQNRFQEHFFKLSLIYLLFKEEEKKWSVLCQKMAFQKMESYSTWVVFYFWQRKILKKPNTLECAQVLVVTCRKLYSDKCLLRPPLRG